MTTLKRLWKREDDILKKLKTATGAEADKLRKELEYVRGDIKRIT